MTLEHRYCGLFGHKATGGSVPNTGTFPHIPSDSLISRYCQIGPTVRFIEDLYPFMNILYGPDGVDKQVRDKSEIRLSSPRDFHPQKHVVVFDLHEPFQSCLKGCSRYHPEMKRAHNEIVKNMLRHFENSDHVVLSVRKDLPELEEAFDIWSSMLDASRSQTFLETISSQGDHVLTTCEALIELLKCILRCNRTCRDGTYDHTLPAVGTCIFFFYHSEAQSSTLTYYRSRNSRTYSSSCSLQSTEACEMWRASSQAIEQHVG